MSSIKKPTGTISQDKISQSGVETKSIIFPNTKEEIEVFIAKQYISESLKSGEEITLNDLNETDDFDFNCIFNGNAAYLELMEIAYLNKTGYENAELKYLMCDFAKYILGHIRKKSKRYKGVTAKPILLLLYITDYKFYPVPKVLDLLEFWLRSGSDELCKIDVFCPLVNGRGTLRRIYPSSRNDWAGFSPEQFKGKGVAFATQVNPVVENS